MFGRRSFQRQVRIWLRAVLRTRSLTSAAWIYQNVQAMLSRLSLRWGYWSVCMIVGDLDRGRYDANRGSLGDTLAWKDLDELGYWTGLLESHIPDFASSSAQSCASGFSLFGMIAHSSLFRQGFRHLSDFQSRMGFHSLLLRKNGTVALLQLHTASHSRLSCTLAFVSFGDPVNDFHWLLEAFSGVYQPGCNCQSGLLFPNAPQGVAGLLSPESEAFVSS